MAGGRVHRQGMPQRAAGVPDIEGARAELVERGIEVSEGYFGALRIRSFGGSAATPTPEPAVSPKLRARVGRSTGPAQRPGRRLRTSCSTQPLPSGSVKVANEP
ncbi:hypothetical protein GCM10009679_56610 [Saccharothrix algeriensis]|uniref:Uncharacterized protein n=1 Tax=Catellatospora bangladeshensis TaxID=310355 RepID=A0A8J3NIN3_9ACTN|nr:hypothetical protein Cba03nite_39490 [Catellatospora bangladeshensis]